MYPVIRLLRSTFGARFRSSLSVFETSEFNFYVRPWDIDMFMELNNGRILTLFDLGRFDLAVRCGLSRQLKANRWGLVVAGTTIRYRKRILLGQHVSIKTRLVAADARWLYLQQTALVDETACCSAVVRTAVTKDKRLHPVSDVAQQMGEDFSSLAGFDWVNSWIELEDQRPWPPTD